MQAQAGFSAATINCRGDIQADADAIAVALTIHELGHNQPEGLKADMVREAVGDALRLAQGRQELGGGGEHGVQFACEQDSTYTTNILGESLRVAAGAAGATKPTRRRVRGHAQPVAGLRGTEAPPSEYLTRTIVGSEAQQKLGAKTLADAAVRLDTSTAAPWSLAYPTPLRSDSKHL